MENGTQKLNVFFQCCGKEHNLSLSHANCKVCLNPRCDGGESFFIDYLDDGCDQPIEQCSFSIECDGGEFNYILAHKEGQVELVQKDAAFGENY